MSIVNLNPTAEQRVTLGNVSWATYVELCENASNPRGRMTYDEGELEIMSPSHWHENASRLIGRMIEMFTLLNQIEISSSKSTTFKRHKKLKGFEADESYYIVNAAAMLGVNEIDLEIYPPPDIAIEVDISRSSHLKMRVFAGLGVGEVWRYDGERLTVHILQGAEYRPNDASVQLPGFPVKLANELLSDREKQSENALVNRFVDALKK